MENTKNWSDFQTLVTHEDGCVLYATVWFDGIDVVAIEPYSINTLDNGEVVHHYYNRVMGEELMEYEVAPIF